MAKRPNPIICHPGEDNAAPRLAGCASDVPLRTGAGCRAAKVGMNVEGKGTVTS